MKITGPKKRQRANSPFLRSCIRNINTEIREAYDGKVTAKDRYWKTIPKITPRQAEDVFQQYRGRCAYCESRLSYLHKDSIYAAWLHFYVPLRVGGEARPDNLIVICGRCKNNYKGTRPLREDIVGLDSFADTCEALFRAVKNGADRRTIGKIKAKLNTRLEDVATCMHYITRSDWVPDSMEKVEDGVNTISERLEDMAEGKDTKKEITNDMKQIVTTKQYKIIRSPKNADRVR